MREEEIQLQEIQTFSPHQEAQGGNNDSGSYSSEDEVTELDIRVGKHGRSGPRGLLESSEDDGDNLSELPPLAALQVTTPDVVFSGIVFLVTVLQLVFDLTLVVWHLRSGHPWGAAFTCTFLSAGGVALLNQFWVIPRETLKSVYTKGGAVRVLVNCFPPLATIITSFQVTTCSQESRSNPMLTHRFVKLDELSRSLLKVQGFAQAAPQAVLQLVLLLEDFAHAFPAKGVTMLCCVITCLIMMTVANLPAKTEFTGGSVVPKAAYSPRARLFIGLRMISSFGSRLMSVSLFTSSFRCVFPRLSDSEYMTFVDHLIPLSVVLVPRFLFALGDWVASRISKNNSRNESSSSTFLDIFLAYLATVFFPFGEPRWVFWYVTVESTAFVVFGGIVEWGFGNYCFGESLWVGVAYVSLFVVLFVGVPCCLPYLLRRSVTTNLT